MLLNPKFNEDTLEVKRIPWSRWSQIIGDSINKIIRGETQPESKYSLTGFETVLITRHSASTDQTETRNTLNIQSYSPRTKQ